MTYLPMLQAILTTWAKEAADTATLIREGGIVAILLLVIGGLGFLYYLERKRTELLYTLILQHGQDVTAAVVSAGNAIRELDARSAVIEKAILRKEGKHHAGQEGHAGT